MNGWKLQNIHDMLHIVRDIENFGSPKNVVATPNENKLIDFAKDLVVGKPIRIFCFPSQQKIEGVRTYMKSLPCIVEKFGQQELQF